MLAEGRGHQLYDANMQRQCQQRYAGGVGTLYIHPPFEAAVYLAVAWLPLKNAYLLWFLINLGFLAASVDVLAQELPFAWSWRICFAVSLTYVPVLLCLQQGQDSLLLLLLIAFAFKALRSGRALAAGFCLGLSIFKFELLLPLAAVLVLTQGRKTGVRLAMGFSSIVLVLAGFSVLISGWSVFGQYAEFLLHLQSQPFAGINPEAMANFRGMVYFLFRGERSSLRIAVVMLLSVAAVTQVFILWKQQRGSQQTVSFAPTQDGFDSAFASTILFVLLVSYHLNPHDLSLLLLPMFLLSCRVSDKTRTARERWFQAALLSILFLPPLHVWGLRAGVYVAVGVPVFLLFLSSNWFRGIEAKTLLPGR